MENLQAQRCRARLDHLESVDAENLSEWNNVRLKRILVDYMLRMSYYDTAMKLAESSNILVIYMLGLFYMFAMEVLQVSFSEIQLNNGGGNLKKLLWPFVLVIGEFGRTIKYYYLESAWFHLLFSIITYTVHTYFNFLD